MKKKVTIQDIARLAGVSDTTVSLSFKEKSRISEETRSNVLRIAHELNYFPNLSARNLRYGLSKSIGFIVNDITDPFYARMIRSMERTALDFGYNTIFAESNWDHKKEIQTVSNMIENRVQGIIICFCEQTEESYNIIQKFNLPHIAVDTIPTYYNGLYVLNDVIDAGKIAAEHLISIGCKNLVFFNARKEMHFFSSFKNLKKGFQSYANPSPHIQQDVIEIEAGITVDGGIEGFNRLLSSGKKFDGIFCVNDLCAYGVMEGAEKNGIKVGHDVAVIGVDNLETSKLARFSLTSIDQPYEMIMEIATKSLIQVIEKGTTLAIKKKIKPHLILRQSTSFKQ